MDMGRTANQLTVSYLLIALSVCLGDVSSAAEPPNTGDSKGLVEFFLPSGWHRLPSSRSSRFVPDCADAGNAMLGVIPEAPYPSFDLETFWANTKAKHEIQGQSLVRESSCTLNGFDLREAVYEAERNGQAIVYHDLYLFSAALQIELHLNSTADAHRRLAPDLQTLAASVRELAEAYPKAKVLLSTCRAGSWAESFSSTLLTLLAAPESWPEPARPWLEMVTDVVIERSLRGKTGQDDPIAAFEAQEAAVKAAIEPERLLVFEVRAGWEPRCRFLDQPVPSSPFPRTNTKDEFFEIVTAGMSS